MRELAETSRLVKEDDAQERPTESGKEAKKRRWLESKLGSRGVTGAGGRGTEGVGGAAKDPDMEKATEVKWEGIKKGGGDGTSEERLAEVKRLFNLK